jgi:hypothetical protein
MATAGWEKQRMIERERAALDLGWERDDKWARCIIEWIEGD